MAPFTAFRVTSGDNHGYRLAPRLIRVVVVLLGVPPILALSVHLHVPILADAHAHASIKGESRRHEHLQTGGRPHPESRHREIRLLPGVEVLQLVRIYLLTGEPDKALDQLQPLLQIPFYLSPGWLRLDPAFDPVRTHPRFERLIAPGS
jgi:hypothetical protein